ncbi:MAG TPA: hypothetical protein DCP92_09540 [Nitrospiraceae bacterium]|jgi:quercetin dioxygenase-like cupin family protein|nr:hypothetical protein [Nitrospiraceae bacterium]
MYKVDFEKVEWKSPVKGMRYKSFCHNNRQLRLVEYTKNMPLHWCEKGHIGYVLEGQIEIEYANKTITYETGDGIFIPNGREHRHKGKALTDMVRVVFVEDV